MEKMFTELELFIVEVQKWTSRYPISNHGSRRSSKIHSAQHELNY